MRNYFETSRTHTYSLLFALPLLLAYELGAASIAGRGGSLRNGADVLLRSTLAIAGVQSTLAFTGVLIVAALVFIALEQRRKRVPIRGGVFALMLLESAGYALAFGAVVGTVTAWLMGTAGGRLASDAGAMGRLPLAQGVILSLGAGIYEELFFRVLMVGGLIVLFRSGGLEKGRASFFAAVLAALLFSAFHYIGPYAYPWTLSSFLFRFLSGLVFSGMFVLRGFGVTAWTHALYDVFLTVARGG
ncbi:MAG: Abortive infection protein [Gemmatimonadetes bacterium]|nr:Abortive infection protein [Gemmatimonadota bacterium]